MKGDTIFPKFIHCSDTAFLVSFGDEIHQEIHLKVMAFFKAINRQLPEGVLALVPTYCAVMVVYDPVVTTPDRLQPHLEKLIIAATCEQQSHYGRMVEIPVCYGGDHGPDLCQVAGRNGLTPEEVIQRHSLVEYPIYMIGFSPGFPFLGGLDPKLHTPRLATPRSRVPAGSVGIADAQTGIYTVESPGGWQLIGRTPLKLFRPDHPEPFRYRVGDRLRFTPVTHEEFHQIQAKESS